MAHQIGPIKITGTIGDLCFYKSGEDYLVRMKGGPSKTKIMTSPNFARTRENITEFGACSQAGAFLRRNLKRVLSVSDVSAYKRMTKVMSQIKNYDAQSRRGERKVSEGLKQAAAKQLLCDFSFNIKSPLKSLLLKNPGITNKHELLVDIKSLVFPAGATRAIFSGALLDMDFETKTVAHSILAEGMVLAGHDQAMLRLSLKDVPDKRFMHFYFLQVCFYTEDGSSLQQGAVDSLGCIAIDPEVVQENKKPILKGVFVQAPVHRPVRKRVRIPKGTIMAVESYVPG